MDPTLSMGDLMYSIAMQNSFQNKTKKILTNFTCLTCEISIRKLGFEKQGFGYNYNASQIVKAEFPMHFKWCLCVMVDFKPMLKRSGSEWHK
jgi:hypothetical protein